VLRDGALKRGVNVAEAMLEDVGEANEDGKADAAQLEPVDQLLEIDRARRLLRRMNLDVPSPLTEKYPLLQRGTS